MKTLNNIKHYFRRNIKLNIIIHFVIPILFILIPFTIINTQKELIYFPDSNVIIKGDTGGKSEISKLETNSSGILFQYTIKKDKTPFPYAEIELNKNRFTDISDYDSVKIEIESSSSKTLKMSLVYFIEGYTKKNKKYSNYCESVQIPIFKKKKKYQFNIKEFQIPNFWYETNRSYKDNISLEIDKSKLSSIWISGDEHLLNIKDKIKISKISFLKNNEKLIFISIIVIAFYLLITHIRFIVILHYISLSQKLHQVIIPYQHLQINDKADQQQITVFEYIKKNYKDPDLTLPKVNYKTDIPINKISKIIKKNYNLTFPQYINALRLEEVKKLLKNSDQKIIEIAYNCGFNSLANFNKIFKKIEAMSPSEYRKK